MDCRVVVEAAVSVYDVETVDEAVRIAISKTGKLLNPDLNFVEIEMAEPTGPDGESLPPAYIVADEALVALELTMDVFNVEQEEHARRVARTEIGQRLTEIPLKVVSVEKITETDEESEESADDEIETADDETEADDETKEAEEAEQAVAAEPADGDSDAAADEDEAPGDADSPDR